MAQMDSVSDLSDLPSDPQNDFLQEFKQSQMRNAERGLLSEDDRGPDSQYDLDRPGVKVTEEGNTRYERTGVSHLVHAWHEKVKKGAKASVKLFRLSKTNLVH